MGEGSRGYTTGKAIDGNTEFVIDLINTYDLFVRQQSKFLLTTIQIFGFVYRFMEICGKLNQFCFYELRQKFNNVSSKIKSGQYSLLGEQHKFAGVLFLAYLLFTNNHSSIDLLMLDFYTSSLKGGRLSMNTKRVYFREKKKEIVDSAIQQAFETA